MKILATKWVSWKQLKGQTQHLCPSLVQFQTLTSTPGYCNPVAQCFPNSTSEESISADKLSILFKVTGLVCGEPRVEAACKMLVNANSPQLVVKGARFIENFTSILKFMDLSLNFRV